MSLVLSLDDDRLVSEVMIGCLLEVSQSKIPKCLNFDELMAEKIHSRLENFHLDKVFKFQSLSFLMVILENQSSLQEKIPDKFTKNLNCSMEGGGLSFFQFTNQVVEVVYQLFYNSNMPRVSEDMMNKLQMINDPIGDWFLYKYFSVIRVYGFRKGPYMLPSFLIPRLFALEFLRQRLFVEQEHYLKHKKGSSIKFKYTIEAFVASDNIALQIVEDILKGLNFKKEQAMRYDPKGIIH